MREPESYRGAVLHEIHNMIKYEVGLRKQKHSSQEHIEKFIEILNKHNTTLGLPIETKQSLTQSVLQHTEYQDKANRKAQTEGTLPTDTDIDEAFTFITDKKNAKPIVDPLADTPLPEQT
jgi:hypothetical protein